MIDAISEARLKELMPELAELSRKQDEMLGFLTRITQGQRSWAVQDGLYAKGRTVLSDIPCRHSTGVRPPGTCQQHPLGATVTNCRGGYSYHCFGLAFDKVPDDPTQPGYQPDWDETHPTWKKMEDVGKSLGLEVGAFWRTFHDAPHFQLNGRFPVGAPSDELRQIFKDGGTLAVWEEVRKSL